MFIAIVLVVSIVTTQLFHILNPVTWIVYISIYFIVAIIFRKFMLHPHKVAFNEVNIVIVRFNYSKTRVLATYTYPIEKIKSIAGPSSGTSGLRLEFINGQVIHFAVYFNGLFYKDDSQELYNDLKYHINRYNDLIATRSFNESSVNSSIKYGFANKSLFIVGIIMVTIAIIMLVQGLIISIMDTFDSTKVIGGSLLLILGIGMIYKYYFQK